MVKMEETPSLLHSPSGAGPAAAAAAAGSRAVVAGEGAQEEPINTTLYDTEMLVVEMTNATKHCPCVVMKIYRFLH